MFVDFSFLMEGRFREGSPGLQQEIFPPSHLPEPRLIDSRGPSKGVDGSLSGLVMFPFDHEIYFFEFLVYLLDDGFVLIIEHFFVLLHLDIYMFYSLEFLI